MSITAPSKKMSLLVVTGMLALTVWNVASYAGLFSPHPTPPQAQLSLPGLAEQSEAIKGQATTQSHSFPWLILLPILIPIAAIMIISGAIGGVLLYRQYQKRQRDNLRLKDLSEISQAFEQYYNRHGHYPVSASYDAQYYSAVNIHSEWDSYNFPPAEEMRQLNHRWPPSDPNIDPQSHSQIGNYLYYPHHFGQRFSLYTQLEAPKQRPIPDYNVIDQLPPTEAKYNYRFNGQDHHPNADPPIQANHPAPTVATPTPQTAPTS